MMPNKFAPGMRERALRMLAGAIARRKNKTAAVQHVTGLLGMSPETLRTWARRMGVDAGGVPRPMSDMLEESHRLRRENAGCVKRTRSSGGERVFREGTRPALDEMIRFIDRCRDRFGVEFICRVLRSAVRGFVISRGYRAEKIGLSMAAGPAAITGFDIYYNRSLGTLEGH